MNTAVFNTLAGWVGSISILLAYVLVSTHRVRGSSRIYQGLNILGALGILAVVAPQRIWSSIILQLIWIGIALYSLVHVRHRQRKLKNRRP